MQTSGPDLKLILDSVEARALKLHEEGAASVFNSQRSTTLDLEQGKPGFVIVRVPLVDKDICTNHFRSPVTEEKKKRTFEEEENICS